MAHQEAPSSAAYASYYCAYAGLAVVAGCLLLSLMQAGGCASDAAASNQAYPEDSFPPNTVLTFAQQQEVLAVFDDIARDAHGRPLVPAPEGFRWADVPTALGVAARRCMLGLATVTTSEEEVHATLVLPDGQTGLAVVTRTTDGVGVQTTLGVLGDPKAEALFNETFSRALARLGQVRRPQE